MSRSRSASPARHTCDAVGRQITLTDGNVNTTQIAYDSKGRQSLIHYPLATADTGFDALGFTICEDAGRLLTRVDGNNVTTGYTSGEAGGVSAISGRRPCCSHGSVPIARPSPLLPLIVPLLPLLRFAIGCSSDGEGSHDSA